GGGLPENLPRCLPEGVHGVIDAASWSRPPLFSWLQERGAVPEADLWNTFNVGVGFCLVVPADAVAGVIASCGACGHQAWDLGHIAAGAAFSGGNASGSAPLLAGLPY
ncbi:MAG: AIR synthase-related protein, partial [Cyanobium sp.]